MSLLTLCLLILSVSLKLFVAVPAFLEDDHAVEFAQLTGKVTDDQGAPLVGIRVDISTAAPKVGQGIFCPSCYLDCSKWATTDEQGEFAISDLDPSLQFRLVAAGPSHKAAQTGLVNPDLGPITISLSKLPEDIVPDRILSGIVKSRLGIPIEGALVEPYGAKTQARRWWGEVSVDSTVTDRQGRFSMILPEDFLAVDIRVLADGYCAFQSELLAPGQTVAQIQLIDGASVAGQLIDAGRPVANMSIAVVQVERAIQNGIFIKAVESVTREDGSFEFKHLPPSQKYAIFSVVGESRRTKADSIITTKVFEAPQSGSLRDLGMLSVAKPVSITGKVVHVDGEPLSSNVKLIFGREPAWDLISVPIDEEGRFSIYGLPPETYEIGIVGRGLQLVSEKIPYQMLGPQTFGVYVKSSIEDLVIYVKGN